MGSRRAGSRRVGSRRAGSEGDRHLGRPARIGRLELLDGIGGQRVALEVERGQLAGDADELGEDAHRIRWHRAAREADRVHLVELLEREHELHARGVADRVLTDVDGDDGGVGVGCRHAPARRVAEDHGEHARLARPQRAPPQLELAELVVAQTRDRNLAKDLEGRARAHGVGELGDRRVCELVLARVEAAERRVGGEGIGQARRPLRADRVGAKVECHQAARRRDVRSERLGHLRADAVGGELPADEGVVWVVTERLKDHAPARVAQLVGVQLQLGQRAVGAQRLCERGHALRLVRRMHPKLGATDGVVAQVERGDRRVGLEHVREVHKAVDEEGAVPALAQAAEQVSAQVDRCHLGVGAQAPCEHPRVDGAEGFTGKLEGAHAAGDELGERQLVERGDGSAALEHCLAECLHAAAGHGILAAVEAYERAIGLECLAKSLRALVAQLVVAHVEARERRVLDERIGQRAARQRAQLIIL
mmetsp:Transcript_30870/g.80565  ORF Transcript_30870/g.80565 Transcript_30870/m.80565 type:complete len:479 (-) Transcript_30870:1912-3348(-)